MSTKKTTKSAPQYEATVKVLGKTFKAKGKTALEAITKLDPGNVAGMAILVVKRGKNVRERIIPTVQARRLFNTGGAAREMVCKNFSILFDDI
jgi:hypothetical protein